uniref:ORF2 n=1 Tax=Plasmopara viticola lesion associated mononega virus 1 TaxID=2692008 RepID=A0A6B9Q4Z3_9MONO|nr:ORF2 [Plasmopara viticola lesion associated mononega virus 1]
MERANFKKFYNGLLTSVCKELGMDGVPLGCNALYEKVQTAPADSYFEFYIVSYCFLRCAEEANSELITSSRYDPIVQSENTRVAFIKEQISSAHKLCGTGTDATDGWSISLRELLHGCEQKLMSVVNEVCPNGDWTPKRCLFYRGLIFAGVFAACHSAFAGCFAKKTAELATLESSVRPFLVPSGGPKDTREAVGGQVGVTETHSKSGMF